MSLLGGLGGLLGGALGFLGADKQSDAQMDMFRESRDLPDWLRPFIVGEIGRGWDPVPINYNWLDAIRAAAAGGMPQNMPPMSMNNPMMTFQNVHTPTQGGPWGFGLGPGQLTTEAGIPGAPGPQFVAPGEGFVPGPTGPPAPAGPENGGGGLLNQNILDIARRHQRLVNFGGDDSFNTPTMLDSLQFAMANPEAGSHYDMIMAMSPIQRYRKALENRG